MNMMLRILLTPSCWVRSYKTDETVDKFVQMIIDHKDEIEWIKCDDLYTYIKLRGSIYGLWDCNGWHSYISRINLIKSMDDPHIREKRCEDKMPSRKTCFRFYDEIGKLTEKLRKPDDTLFLKEAISSMGAEEKE